MQFSGYDLTIVEVIRHDDKVYVLAEQRNFDDAGVPRFRLFDCLDNGMVCTDIYKNEYEDLEARLSNEYDTQKQNLIGLC